MSGHSSDKRQEEVSVPGTHVKPDKKRDVQSKLPTEMGGSGKSLREQTGWPRGLRSSQQEENLSQTRWK